MQEPYLGSCWVSLVEKRITKLLKGEGQTCFEDSKEKVGHSKKGQEEERWDVDSNLDGVNSGGVWCGIVGVGWDEMKSDCD